MRIVHVSVELKFKLESGEIQAVRHLEPEGSLEDREVTFS